MFLRATNVFYITIKHKGNFIYFYVGENNAHVNISMGIDNFRKG